MPDLIGSTRIVVTSELDGASGKIMSIATAIGDELNQLGIKLGALPADWSGSAQDSWYDYQQDWNTASSSWMDEQGVLGQIAGQLGIIANEYALGESENIQTWAH